MSISLKQELNEGIKKGEDDDDIADIEFGWRQAGLISVGPTENVTHLGYIEKSNY